MIASVWTLSCKPSSHLSSTIPNDHQRWSCLSSKLWIIENFVRGLGVSLNWLSSTWSIKFFLSVLQHISNLFIFLCCLIQFVSLFEIFINGPLSSVVIILFFRFFLKQNQLKSNHLPSLSLHWWKMSHSSAQSCANHISQSCLVK